MSKDEECPVQFENAINVIISLDKNIGYRKAIYGNPLYGCKWILILHCRTYYLLK